MEWLTTPGGWMALLTLTSLEIVLGVDNIIFISILVGKLPADQQKRARFIGLALAMGARLALLASLTWILKLTRPLFEVAGVGLSGRDLILIGGGLFLLAKSTHEIHDKLEGEEGAKDGRGRATVASVLIQIALLDVVFSLDSVITAIGMADEISIMVIAVIIAVGFMMVFAGAISDFVHRHPTVKILALSFLLLIGATLVAEGLHQHVSKGYIYFAMAFSVFVETLNIRVRRKAQPPVTLREPYKTEAGRP